MNGASFWRKALALVEDYLFPSRCACCGKTVSAVENGACAGCLDAIESVMESCPRCSGQLKDGRCEICSDRMWYLDRNIAAAEYSGTMKKMLRSYKFEKRKRIHRHLGAIAFNALKDQGLEVDMVTAVPMTGTKVWKRGYNQSELVARVLSRRLGCEYKVLLMEKGSSRTQKDLQYRERFINILGRYVPKGSAARGRKVLIVDDVFTTGATINECARVLREAGAERVYGVTIARRSLAD